MGYQQLSFGGLKSYMQVFDCMRVGVPNTHVVEGSIVLSFVGKELSDSSFLPQKLNVQEGNLLRSVL